MMPKNLPQYILENWERYKVTISDASKSDVGVSLVESEEEIYNFDQVCKDFFAGKNVPTSADGVQIQGRNVELVEFKSGFKQRVTKDKFDPDKGTCKSAGKVCTDYWNLFWENQDRKRAQLISSVRTKAIESYVFLEKHILPQCLDYTEGGKMKLVFTVVIDEDGVDGLEDTLAELAGAEPENNAITAIRQALKRFANRKDENDIPYYYDSINVFSAKDFEKRIK